MAAPDYHGIKEKIRDILRNDTTNLFSATPTDKTKFRTLVAGSPDKHDIQNKPDPSLWITNDRLMDVVKDSAVYENNTTKGRFHDIRLKIIMAVQKKDSETAEEQIDDLCKLVIEKLETDIDLRTVGGLESTRVADESKVTEVRDLDPELKGDGVRGRTIIFKVHTVV